MNTTRTEPGNVTLIDLMVLVAGFAVACCMEFESWLPALSGSEARGRFLEAVVCHARMWAWRASFAVAITVMVRRIRHGGRYSTGEFACLMYGAGMVCLVLRLAIELLDPFRQTLPSWLIDMPLVELAYALVGGTLVRLGRGHWPAWITGLGLAVALSGVGTATSSLLSRVAVDVQYSRFGPTWSSVAFIASAFPSRTIVDVVLVTGIVSFWRSPKRSHSWTDSAGLFTSLATWAFTIMRGFVIIFMIRFVAVWWPVALALELLAWLLAFALVRRFGPAFTRWWNRGLVMHGVDTDHRSGLE